jgi:hypothetical protein
MAAEHEGTLKHPLLLGSGLEFVLVGFADALLFHTRLFCLTGTKSATVRTFVALTCHPAFIPIAEARGPQPVSVLELARTGQDQRGAIFTRRVGYEV